MNFPTTAVLTERVQAGAAHADAHWGRWWQEVNPDELDLIDARTCLLGQLFWNRMVDALDYVDRPMWTDLARHVFPDDEQPCYLAADLGFDGPDGTHGQLTDLWRAEIARRRAAA